MSSSRSKFIILFILLITAAFCTQAQNLVEPGVSIHNYKHHHKAKAALKSYKPSKSNYASTLISSEKNRNYKNFRIDTIPATFIQENTEITHEDRNYKSVFGKTQSPPSDTLSRLSQTVSKTQ